MSIKRIIVPLCFLGLIFLAFFVNSFIRTKKSFHSSYHLVIDKIKVGSKKECFFYSKGKEINLTPYLPSSFQNIKEGDSISKEDCGKYVYFYRKDSLGNYYEYLKLMPIYILPQSWFCDN